MRSRYVRLGVLSMFVWGDGMHLPINTSAKGDLGMVCTSQFPFRVEETRGCRFALCHDLPKFHPSP